MLQIKNVFIESFSIKYFIEFKRVVQNSCVREKSLKQNIATKALTLTRFALLKCKKYLMEKISLYYKCNLIYGLNRKMHIFLFLVFTTINIRNVL